MNNNYTFGGIFIWIGIDDTDSRDRGCTTYLVNHIIEEFKEYDIVGFPYLVRLNPNIPWKTRGNGAVCLQLIKIGKEMVWEKSGLKDNGNFFVKSSNPSHDKRSQSLKSETTTEEILNALERLEKIIVDNASLEEPTTNPGIVITPDSGLPLNIYWSAVRGVVELDHIRKNLDTQKAVFKGYKKGRGIIGASGAIAWAVNQAKALKTNISNGSNISNLSNTVNTVNLGNANNTSADHTFELITYREPSRWGTYREVDAQAVIQMDDAYPSTFNNYDPATGHVTITPNSPCPVLFGIRGDSITDLKLALEMIKPHTEPIDKWLMFQTNQGTDDHLIRTSISNVLPYTSVILTGEVKTGARTIPGGHVLLELHCNDEKHGDNCKTSQTGVKDRNNESLKEDTITCAAYEPTKGFRNVVRALLPGDIIQVSGGVRHEPVTVNIEKLEVLNLVQDTVKLHNPMCPVCGRRMKSIGHVKGYRCRKCHYKTAPNHAEMLVPPRLITRGFYEVPVSARRHLSKPLKRLKNTTGIIYRTPKSF